LSGSPIYAEHDPNLDALSARDREALFAVERLAMMYLPRTCNHCANPACVASCPSAAIYKRGEDGIVLASQEACRGWRACVVGCPYKKIYYNWKSGKSEKCILCYPRLEAGQPPACFHACVGRIRYQGVVLYDASRIADVASAPAEGIVAAQRSMLLDPFDPEVVAAAERAGVGAQMIRAAQLSPVWKFVRAWGLALPLHPEYRTLPMLFYVPPLLPVMGGMDDGIYRRDRVRWPAEESAFAGVDQARLPVRYLAALFAAGNEELVRASLRKLVAVRHYRRWVDIEGRTAAGGPYESARAVDEILSDAGLSREEAEAIYRLTALATIEDRYVLPPLQREAGMAEDRAERLRQICGLDDIAPQGR
ncbi:MAG TPA: 4Fe-4S dicluster domain-containing protein, partial [Thermoanaerobaculia bacterium]